MKSLSPKERSSRRRALLAVAVGCVPGWVYSGQPTLPTPCLGTCAGVAGFVTSGAASAVQSGTTLKVSQTSSQATLNWSTFNVGTGDKVVFQQPSTNAVALNRIYQANPSSIFGELTANGQIYLVNPNGFVFGSTATVDVAGMIASSLAISDANFSAGLVNPQLLLNGTPALGTPSSGSGAPAAVPGAINIDAGAQLSAQGGRILIAAPSISNSGSIQTPDGQVILAAGQQVYLQASSDPALRGLIVQVDTGGTVSNQGVLSADRGNVSLIGLAVNQNGRISATTSVAENGSVILQAAGSTNIQDGNISGSEGGTLTLGSQSSIQILPEVASSATAVADQAQLQSTVKLSGEAVDFHGGTIDAPNAALSVVAASNPGLGVQTDGNSLAQIRIDPGTSINLAGSNAVLPMSANLLTIQLRANELEDDPTQRNGPLRGLTVYVDARVGSPLISSSVLEADIGNIPESIAERTETGGNASFQSEGDIVFQPGASINVSGGKSTYEGGVLQTTQLIGADGALYDIGSANPLIPYAGVVNPTFTQTYNTWGVQNIVPTPGLSHYEAGYVQGASAGSVQFAAPSMVLSGSLAGNAVNGEFQRGGSSVAAGGQLIVGLPGALASNPSDYLAPDITFVVNPIPIEVSDGTPLPVQSLQLPVAYITTGGFTRTDIYSNGVVILPAGLPLNLDSSGAGGMTTATASGSPALNSNPGGDLFIQAPRINLLSSITAPDGNIQLQTVSSVESANPLFPRPGIEIGEGVVLDVRGQWTNDTPDQSNPAVLAGQTLQNGGSISLNAGITGSELAIGDDVAFEASGGAWLQGNGTVTPGTGGSISIASGTFQAALQIGSKVRLDAFGVDGASGGDFSLTAPRVEIGNFGPTWAAPQAVDDLNSAGAFIQLSPSLFSDYGFSSVSLTANGPMLSSPAGAAPGAVSSDIFTVLSGTTISARAQTLELPGGNAMIASSNDVNAFAQLTTLPTADRLPVNVVLNAVPQVQESALTQVGLLDVQRGASILTDPGATIALTGVGGILVDGELSAPGGDIELHIPTPTLSPDPGFVSTLAISLGAQALLNVAGTTVYTPNDQGLLLGNVLAGGTVSLLADRGSVIAQTGSRISVAGTSATLDIPPGIDSPTYNLYTVPSSAGSVVVHAPESISLLGTLQAQAGIGNYGDPAPGSLEVDLTRSEPWFEYPASPGLIAGFPTAPRVIQVVSSTAGMPQSSPLSGLAVLGVDQLSSSGIGSLRLEAGDDIELASTVPLNLSEQAIFDAPALSVDAGVNAKITTAYASLGNSLPLLATQTLTTYAGFGNLQVDAQHIDLVGSFALQGIAKTDLTSSGEIELNGTLPTGGSFPTGELLLNGNLEMNAARIYPATATAFALDAVGAGNVINIGPATQAGSTTATAAVPLSAGGSVLITADQIVSTGTLLAPFGTIDLTANGALDLAKGSVTSVSGTGSTIPYGQTELGGLEWIYTPAGTTPQTIDGVPVRAVSLTAPQVTVASGASIVLSGGGDLQAYEWVPGTGGTANALGAGVTPGLYAVLPSLRGQYAPYDPEETPGTSLKPGESIYLSGGGGLAAGVYPLLPATYALLPGAYLVQVQSGYSNIAPGEPAALANNTPVIAGYLTFGDTGLHSSSQNNGGYVGVAVWPGSYGEEIASYTLSNASTYFPAAAAAAHEPAPVSTADAGSLTVNVQDGLDFFGSIQGNLPGSAGLSSVIDISATQLVVTGSNPAPIPAGAVALAGSVIQGWKAGELLLGGESSGNGTTIDVTASTVTIEPGAQVSANQVILVANQSIDVQPGASVVSSSALPGSVAPATVLAPTSVSLATANASPDLGAAMLAVSDLALPVVQLPSSTAGTATIEIAPGATVASLGALSFSGPGGVNLAGTLSGKGASWSLASGSIGLLGAGSSDSLQIDAGVLTQLQTASAVQLQSAGALDIYAPLSLGATSVTATPSLTTLTLSAASINNQDGGGSALFGAKTLTLAGGTAGASTPPASSAGSLIMLAEQIDLGPGVISIGGFANTSLKATSAVIGQNAGTAGGIETLSGNLNVNAPLLTALGGSQTELSAPDGTLAILSPATGTRPTLANDLGGSLSLNAAQIQVAGAVILPSGLITLQATNDIDVTPNAILDGGGRDLTIVNQTAGSEGGTIILDAGANLDLASGAILSVAGAGDAPAGSIILTAGAAADVLATLTGQAGKGALGGNFSIDAGELTAGLNSLSSRLRSGGFSGIESVTAETGNLSLGPGATLSANQITLTANAGSVDIAGTLDATNADLRGEIAVFGTQGVTLESSGRLLANTTGGEGIGGNIELGTANGGAVTLNPGSVVSAIGTSATGLSLTGAASNGQLMIRAPLVGDDVAVNLSGSNLTGLSQVVIEPVMTMAINSAPQAADFAGIETTIASNMAAAAPAISARLNPDDTLPLVVRPAVDLEQSGSLTLTSSLDLYASSWQFAGQPVDLNFRVGGSITVGQNTVISDGFTVSDSGIVSLPVTAQQSASFRLVAGANQASADPLATVAGSAAGITLDPGSVIRTGTGALDLVAAGDITFTNPGTSGLASAEVYTAGIAGSASVAVNNSNFEFNFPTGGGDVLIRAGGDLIGSPVAQAVTVWQLRRGQTGGPPVNWGTDFDQFAWNIGSLGGGDVSVAAAGNIENLSVAAADSYATPTKTSTSTYFASGGLDVRAGGDIGSGQFLESQGSSLISAGGAFSQYLMVPGDTNAGSTIALGNSQVSIEARLGVYLDAVYDPTALGQLVENLPNSLASAFFTYGPQATLIVQSSSGDVTLANDIGHLLTLMGQSADSSELQVLPATLLARAFQGNLYVGGQTLIASDSGQLDLLAGGNIVGSSAPVVMTDAYASAIPTPQNPGLGGAVPTVAATAEFASGRHIDDPMPVMVTAGGDIDTLYLSVPKAAQIYAGQDINNLQFLGQNLNPTDQTIISAGRDFVDSLDSTSTTVQLGGPGQLDVLAGQNIDLGFSQGITTVGSLINPNLASSQGASITVLAGLGQAPDYADFLGKIIAPSFANQNLLIDYVESNTGQTGLSFASAATEFAALSPTQQLALDEQIFFDELGIAGNLVNTNPTAGFAQGDAAIDGLFPNSRTTASPYQGDLSLTFSRIYTLSGGTITLLTPGGGVDVGLANPPASLAVSRTPSELGIVAQGAGDVDIYSQGDVNVNASRIFTLGGGNILIWSNEGSIDAGQGAKSSVSAPPPEVEVDAAGNVTLDFQGAVAGSGIRTIQVQPTTPAGNVELIAPEGTVNAGDAGIGAAGNITIYALHVVGLDNINFGGTSVGVPAQVSNLGASLSGASTAASATTNTATSAAANTADQQAAAPLGQTALSWLDVFVTGLGEENCKPNDTECLKRQKPGL